MKETIVVWARAIVILAVSVGIAVLCHRLFSWPDRAGNVALIFAFVIYCDLSWQKH